MSFWRLEEIMPPEIYRYRPSPDGIDSDSGVVGRQGIDEAAVGAFLWICSVRRKSFFLTARISVTSLFIHPTFISLNY